MQLIVGAVVATGLVCAPALASDQDLQGASAAANKWLAEVDGGRFDQSWNDAAAQLQSAVSEPEWSSKVGALRQQFGPLQHRELADATFTKTLPGMPDGAYVVMHYRSSFANKASAIETVTPMKTQDGSWQVSGYFVR